MQISQTTALLMVLLTTLLWGSWSQFVKKLDDWPIPAFMFWLYLSGFVLVSACILFLKKHYIPGGILASIQSMPAKCLLVFVCGVTFAIGMQLNMTVVKKAGLIFSTSIMSLLSIPVGCTVSSIFGGLPEDVSILRIIMGVAFLLSATLLCQKSTRMCDADNHIAVNAGKTRLKYILILIICAVGFSPTYTMALSIGTMPENGVSLSPVLLVWILSGGALLGTSAVSLPQLARRRQLDRLFTRRDLRHIGLACVSGVFHFGGNLLHTVASPVVSVAIAWPLGYLSTVWQYFWGIIRGEFRGAKKITWAVLFSGILMFIVALITLTSALYW